MTTQRKADGTTRGGQELPDELQDRPEQNAGYDDAARGRAGAEPETTDSGLDRDRDGAIGAIDESPRDSGEVTASDPVTASGRAREERTDASASGLTADDPDAGEARKRAYKDGATLVSRID